MKEQRGLKLVFAFLPHIGVATGLFLLSNALVAMTLYLVALFIGIALFKGFKDFKTVIKGWNWKFGLAMTVMCALTGVALYVLWDFVSIKNLDLNSVLAKLKLSSWSLFIFFFYLLVVNPIFEEIFWRKTLTVNKYFDIIFDALFAAYHLMVLQFFVNPLGLIFAFFCLFIAASLWRILYKKQNGLLIPIISHFMADLSFVVFFVQLVMF